MTIQTPTIPFLKWIAVKYLKVFGGGSGFCLFIFFHLPLTACAGKHGIFHAYYPQFQDLAKGLDGVFKQILKIPLFHSGISLSNCTCSGSLKLHSITSPDTETMDFCLNSSHTALGGLAFALRPYKHELTRGSSLLSFNF